MKKTFSALMICMMVLCISNVSFGSDISNIQKSTNEFAFDNDQNLSVFEIDCNVDSGPAIDIVSLKSFGSHLGNSPHAKIDFNVDSEPVLRPRVFLLIG